MSVKTVLTRHTFQIQYTHTNDVVDFLETFKWMDTLPQLCHTRVLDYFSRFVADESATFLIHDNNGDYDAVCNSTVLNRVHKPIAVHILEYIRQPLAVDIVACQQSNVVKLVIQRVSTHQYDISTHPDNPGNILLFRHYHHPSALSRRSLATSMVMYATQLHINLTVLKLLKKIQPNMYNLVTTIQRNVSHFTKKKGLVTPTDGVKPRQCNPPIFDSIEIPLDVTSGMHDNKREHTR